MFFLFYKENNTEQKQAVFLQTVERLEAPSLLVFLLGLRVIPYQQGKGLQDMQLRCTRFSLQMLRSGISFFVLCKQFLKHCTLCIVS